MPPINHAYFSSSESLNVVTDRDIPPISVVVNRIKSNKEYRAIWQTWGESAPVGEGEYRDIAVKRLEQCLRWPFNSLDLKGLGLSVLPELPPFIKNLDVSDNKLTVLSELPSSLEKLDVHNNRMIQLPTWLPSSLKYLDASNNQFSYIPESITSLSPEVKVNIANNPFLEEKMDKNICNYPDPVINSGAPLHQIVTCWSTSTELEHRIDKNRRIWVGISKEMNANEFSIFLDRLKGTGNAAKCYPFREEVAEWLQIIFDIPILRETTFTIAAELATSGNKVVSIWNKMQKACLIHDIRCGKYDNKLPELMRKGREMFRLEKLEQIIQKKSETFSDKNKGVDIYLLFQALLSNILKVPCPIKNLRYFPEADAKADGRVFNRLI